MMKVANTNYSYHIFLNHSEIIAKYGIQLDSIGIVILMWGATMPSIYYGLYCDSTLQKIYWAIVSPRLYSYHKPDWRY
jgi:adiponectin receptor